MDLAIEVRPAEIVESSKGRYTAKGVGGGNELGGCSPGVGLRLAKLIPIPGGLGEVGAKKKLAGRLRFGLSDLLPGDVAGSSR